MVFPSDCGRRHADPHPHATEARDRDYEAIIRRTLEGIIPLGMHPRTSIMVVLQVSRISLSPRGIRRGQGALQSAPSQLSHSPSHPPPPQVLQDDGALLSCALNAACAALVDAGVPMDAMLAAVTCALLPGGAVLLDPSGKEEEDASALVSIALPFHFDLIGQKAAAADGASTAKPMPVVGADLLAPHTFGCFTAEQYFEMVATCRGGSTQVAEFSRLVLQRG